METIAGLVRHLISARRGVEGLCISLLVEKLGFQWIYCPVTHRFYEGKKGLLISICILKGFLNLVGTEAFPIAANAKYDIIGKSTILIEGNMIYNYYAAAKAAERYRCMGATAPVRKESLQL